MKPVSPVIRGYEHLEVQVGEGQPEYIPIPTIVSRNMNVEGERRFISRWEFTPEERKLIANGGTIVFHQLVFGEESLFNPICLLVEPAKIVFQEDDSCLCNGIGCVKCCGPA
jgi:hypothetical protein